MIRTPKTPPAVGGKRSARAQYLRQLADLEEENKALRDDVRRKDLLIRTLKRINRRATGVLRDVQRESANVAAVILEIEKAS